MIELARPDVLSARAQFCSRAWFTPAYSAYVKQHNLVDMERISAFAGATAVIPIIDCGNHRFEFGKIGVDPLGFVCEAYGADGETAVDLVAWLLDEPQSVLTMFGRAAWIGAGAVWNPASYYMGRALPVHRTALDWLKSGCVGAAIVTPHLAARDFLDLPGPMAARDQAHGQQLLALAKSLVDPTRILVPNGKRPTA